MVRKERVREEETFFQGKRLPAGLYYEKKTDHIRSHRFGFLFGLCLPTFLKTVFLQPIERISVVLRTHPTLDYATSMVKKPGIQTFGRIPVSVEKYSSPFNVVKNLMKGERANWKTFWRGASPMVLYNIVNSNYVTIIAMDRFLGFGEGNRQSFVPVLSGITFAFLAGYPFRVASTRMMLPLGAPRSYSKWMGDLKKMYLFSGSGVYPKLRVFYAGAPPLFLYQICMVFPITTYNNLRKKAERQEMSEEERRSFSSLTFLQSISILTLSLSLTYPLVVISDNMIASSFFPLVLDTKNPNRIESLNKGALLGKEAETILHKENVTFIHNDYRSVVKEIWRRGGIRAFYRAFSLRIITLPLIFLGIY